MKSAKKIKLIEEEMTTTHIEYTRTVVPSTMRSPFWKYFGFPSDNQNQILTRQKIICTLCNTAIAYNKNTSNLRTHLIARHPVLFRQLTQDPSDNEQPTHKNLHDLTVAPLEVEAPTAATVIATHQEATCPKLSPYEFGYSDDGAAHSSDVEEVDLDQDHQLSTIDGADELMHQTAHIGQNAANFADLTTAEEEAAGSDSDVPFTYIVEPPFEKPLNPAANLHCTDLIVEMLVTDLVASDTFRGRGFQQLMGHLGNVDKSTIEAKLVSLHASMQCKIAAHLEEISQKFAYSFSVECYENIENVNIICVYFNYFDGECRELASVLLNSSKLEDFNFNDTLMKFNLENCAALVVSVQPNAIISEFANGNDIPTINCLDEVLTRTMKEIFNLPLISAAYEEIYKLTEQSLQQDSMLMIMPEVYPACPWSKLNFLQFVLDNLVLDNVHVLKEMRHFVEYINPLKVILETIAGEPLPLCTLIRPLLVKLLEEHFFNFNIENKLLTEARAIIEETLPNGIVKNTFLNEATFFDARFQHYFIDEQQQEADRTALKQAVCKRFKRFIEVKNVQKKPPIKIEQNATSTSRKSSLKSFFNRNPSNGATSSSAAHKLMPQKTNIDLEFDRYKCEPTLDLEQCPISWWQEHAYNYKQLQKIANYYLCVPCCVNRLFRSDANERSTWLNKRFMLRQQNATDKCLWYLHYNQMFHDKLKA